MAPMPPRATALSTAVPRMRYFSVLETAGAVLQQPDEGAERSKPQPSRDTPFAGGRGRSCAHPRADPKTLHAVDLLLARVRINGLRIYNRGIVLVGPRRPRGLPAATKRPEASAGLFFRTSRLKKKPNSIDRPSSGPSAPRLWAGEASSRWITVAYSSMAGERGRGHCAWPLPAVAAAFGCTHPIRPELRQLGL